MTVYTPSLFIASALDLGVRPGEPFYRLQYSTNGVHNFAANCSPRTGCRSLYPRLCQGRLQIFNAVIASMASTDVFRVIVRAGEVSHPEHLHVEGLSDYHKCLNAVLRHVVVGFNFPDPEETISTVIHPVVVRNEIHFIVQWNLHLPVHWRSPDVEVRIAIQRTLLIVSVHLGAIAVVHWSKTMSVHRSHRIRLIY